MTSIPPVLDEEFVCERCGADDEDEWCAGHTWCVPDHCIDCCIYVTDEDPEE